MWARSGWRRPQGRSGVVFRTRPERTRSYPAGWERWLGRCRVICESSGGYERELVEGLQQSGIVLSVVQASRVRQFARRVGGGLRPIASMRSCSLCMERRSGRRRRGPLSLEQERLRALERQRLHLSRLLVMEQNRQSRLRQKELRALEAKLISQSKNNWPQLDELIAQVIAHSRELSVKAAKLTQVSGVAPANPPSWL